MVRTFLPFTATGSVRPEGFCACARSSRPQLQNATPVAAAAAPPLLRKFRRVVIGRPSQDSFVPGSLRQSVDGVELRVVEVQQAIGLLERRHDGRQAVSRGAPLLT